jgi:uncharacterized protein (DUF736 family)
MATIGTFTKTEHGYGGRIKTLTLDIEVSFRPCSKEHEKSPDFRIHAPFGEFGAAWQRVSAAEREYLSCKLDDPVFPAPLYASLVLSDDSETYVLIWTR